MINFQSTLFTISMLVALLFVSCSKDDNTIPEVTTDPIEAASMTALVDGEEWAASPNFEPVAFLYNDYITIGALSSSNYEMNLMLYGTSVGYYNLNPEMGSQLYYRRSGENTYDSKLNNENLNFGFIDIEEIDSENQIMSGTFETEVHYFFNELSTGSKTITEGKFTNVPIIDKRDPDAESLYTEIDGRPLNTINLSGYISQGALVISGEDGAQSEKIQLSMSPEVVEGSYDLGDTSNPIFNAQYNPLFSNVLHTANAGVLTITSHDTGTKIIEGSFNFETPNVDGDGSFEISGGLFRVTY